MDATGSTKMQRGQMVACEIREGTTLGGMVIARYGDEVAIAWEDGIRSVHPHDWDDLLAVAWTRDRDRDARGSA
jgi:hypothetical protein